MRISGTTKNKNDNTETSSFVTNLVLKVENLAQKFDNLCKNLIICAKINSFVAIIATGLPQCATTCGSSILFTFNFGDGIEISTTNYSTSHTYSKLSSLFLSLFLPFFFHFYLMR
jgi:hypothetical protein